MLVPLFGFIVSLTVALLLAGAAIRLDDRLRPVTRAAIAFVASGFVGAVLYAIVYTGLFADESNHLSTRGTVIGLLAGLVIAAAVAGWLGARWFVAVATKR